MLELTADHPMRPLNPLWTACTACARPGGPTADDAVDVLREVGISPEIETVRARPGRSTPSFDDLVAITRQRVCLPPERDDELAEALASRRRPAPPA